MDSLVLGLETIYLSNNILYCVIQQYQYIALLFGGDTIQYKIVLFQGLHYWRLVGNEKWIFKSCYSTYLFTESSALYPILYKNRFMDKSDKFLMFLGILGFLGIGTFSSTFAKDQNSSLSFARF
jgi:hypothetical protein